jgi:hypothetical protein
VKVSLKLVVSKSSVFCVLFGDDINSLFILSANKLSVLEVTLLFVEVVESIFSKFVVEISIDTATQLKIEFDERVSNVDDEVLLISSIKLVLQSSFMVLQV